MRGWPLIEILGVALAFGLALLPLQSLTQSRVSVESSEPEPAAAEKSVFLTAKFVHPPLDFRVLHLGEEIWTVESAGETELFGEASIVIPKEGIDLLIEARWPEETPKTALELTLAPDSLDDQSTTHWGTGEMDAVATYKW